MYFVVDWGTSRLRVSAVDAADGRVVATHAVDRGIATVSAGEHADVFRDTVEELAAADERVAARLDSQGEPLDVYVSGMATSNLGWHPTPYLQAPFELDSLGRHAETDDLTLQLRGARRAWKLHFFPGARTEDDVLRGEEIEALGILSSGGLGTGAGNALEEFQGESILVLPGTHTKWLRCRGRRLLDFDTVPTGDLYAALHSATLISRTLPEAPVEIDERLRHRFEEGLDRVRERGVLTSLFAVRALSVLEDHGIRPDEASALLSGILIGGEVLERLADLPAATPIQIAGAPGLRELYVAAVRRQDGREPLAVRLSAGTSAAILGIQAIRASLAS